MSIGGKLSVSRWCRDDKNGRIEIMQAVLAVGPAHGGVGDAFSQSVAALRRRGWRVIEVRPSDRGSAALGALRALWRHRNALRSADAVHGEFGSNNLEVFWFVLLAALLRRGTVIVAHDPQQIVRSPGAGLISRTGTWRLRLAYRVLSPILDGALIGIAMRRAGAVVVLGKTGGTGGARQTRIRGPILCAPHPRLEPVGEAPAPSKCDYALFAGFLGPHKGLDVLLEAWAQMREHSLRLLIAGDSGRDQADWIAALRERSTQLRQVPEWLGAIDSERDFQQLIDRAAIIVLPYRTSSPASGILVRAMGSGRCVVGTSVPAMTNAVEHERSGIVVPVDDVAALAQQLSRLAGDGSERDRLGAAAAERATKLFDEDEFVDAIERAYRVASGRSHSR
jgi:glycosyltransferase involved in cell wall biosynthesis